MNKLLNSPLGQTTQYVEFYSPDLLFPVPRSLARDNLDIDQEKLPFMGYDTWNGYEISWLNLKGKPIVAEAIFEFPCTSKNIIESKSLKLYLNSFNQTHFESIESVKETIEKDISTAIGSAMTINLYPITHLHKKICTDNEGICLDNLDIETDTYQVKKDFLQTGNKNVEETLYSHLLKSNCLATGQPDWGTIVIRYTGKNIDHEGLLKFIISYRNHSGFAEHCVEEIFNYINDACKPAYLLVYAHYTRRGGLDIAPLRTNNKAWAKNQIGPLR